LEDCHLSARVGEGPKAVRVAVLLFSVLVVGHKFPVTRLSGLLAGFPSLTTPWRRSFARRAHT